MARTIQILVVVDAAFEPVDGDALDAVRDALDYFDIPCSFRVIEADR